jgi:methylmalonyl-CoA mutase cobalamin-binding domain/chain
MDIAHVREFVLEAILQGEREQAFMLLEQYAKTCTYRSAMRDILEPALEDIGNRWSEEKISLAQGYIAGKVAEDLLLKICEEEKEMTLKEEKKGPIILGNIEDDYHSLGRKLVSIFLQSAGWQVHDLGNDVSAEEFVNKAVELNARVIGVSAMMYTTAENIKKVRDELDKRHLTGKIQLAVGGAVFKLRPELADEVGADGAAVSGFNAPALCARLWERSLREVPV